MRSALLSRVVEYEVVCRMCGARTWYETTDPHCADRCTSCFAVAFGVRRRTGEVRQKSPTDDKGPK